MTLPFPKNDGKRKWQCFVCGKTFQDHTAFRNHIITDHEEGREYLICPLTRCQSPVRDLRLHFKAKHPNEHLPPCGPNRAIIWKDFSPSGKSKTRKPSFRSGHFTSIKMHGQDMPYKSSYECEVYECLEALDEVISYHVEPTRIDYLHNGKMHEYLPDLRIQFSDGHVEIWEIKPANQTHIEKNEDKWRAANEYCKVRGWDFVVITEVGIGKLRKKINQRNASI